MSRSPEIVIPISNFKSWLSLSGCIGCIALCVYILTLGPEEFNSTWIMRNQEIAHRVAILGIACFGFAALATVKRMFSTKTGLAINPEGIVDHCSSVSVGLIPWTDIVGFREYQVRSTKLLIVLVKDPKKYEASRNPLKFAINRGNTAMAGSPISIASTMLKIRYAELASVCEAAFEQYGESGNSDMHRVS